MSLTRSKAIGGIVIAAIFAGSAWVFLAEDSHGFSGGIHKVTFNCWGYDYRPRNPVSSWIAKQIEQRDRKKSGAKSRDPVLILEGSELLWSYSNPTSGWFSFGYVV